jgi:MYXO-CTERM domain-containing protein
MNPLTSRHALAAGCLLAIALPGCGGGADGTLGTPYDKLGTTSEALSGNDAVARGALWVAAQVPYCQSPNGQPDPDTSCSSICMRPSNPDWDPYRSDCSGFVSWSWGLPPPGLTTSDFGTSSDVTEVDGNTLEPGDALNIPGDHIIMFVSWVTAGQSAVFYEEPGCSANPPYAHQFTSNIEISGSSVTVDYEGSTFTAIRYNALSGTVSDGGVPPIDSGSGADAGGTPCFVTTLNQSGVCIDTGACAALGNHISTPNYCPGAANIECCTPTGAAAQDSGSPEQPDSGMGNPPPPVDSGTGLEEDSGTGNPGMPMPGEDAGGPLMGPGSDGDGGSGGSGVHPTPPAHNGETGGGPSVGSNGCSAAPAGATSSSGGAWLFGLALILARRSRRRA